ncbi:DUF5983 family protein [Streptomyces avermitilis]
MICSTSHITEETNHWLAEQAAHQDKVQGLVVYPKSSFGWMIPLTDGLRAEDLPEDLQGIFQFATFKECSWIMLDCDAGLIDELPCYSW